MPTESRHRVFLKAGARIGNLTVIRLVRYRDGLYLMRCEWDRDHGTCGRRFRAFAREVSAGRVRSCGCQRQRRPGPNQRLLKKRRPGGKGWRRLARGAMKPRKPWQMDPGSLGAMASSAGGLKKSRGKFGDMTFILYKRQDREVVGLERASNRGYLERKVKDRGPAYGVATGREYEAMLAEVRAGLMEHENKYRKGTA